MLKPIFGFSALHTECFDRYDGGFYTDFSLMKAPKGILQATMKAIHGGDWEEIEMVSDQLLSIAMATQWFIFLL